MNAEGLVSAGGLSKKIFSFLILITLDIFLSVFMVFVDLSGDMGSSASPNAPHENWKDFGIIGSAAQLVIHFLLIFWYFFLVWKTFMFRFGLLSKLAGIFPILYLGPVNFLAFCFERALRYVSQISQHYCELISYHCNFVYSTCS